MPAATEYTASDFVKFVLIGNSGSGKTGALASLVEAGYRVRILDFDMGMTTLLKVLKRKDPKLLEQVDFMSFRDTYVMGPTGPKVKGTPKAYSSGVKALDLWEDGSHPAEWGANTVCVIDSFTHMARAAFAWAKFMDPTCRDPRQWYKTAQDSLADVLQTLTSDDFKTNAIVISHIDIRQQKDGTVKGFVMAVGEALGPVIPSFFNSIILSESTGSGANVKRKLKTLPTAILDLKNSNPFEMAAEYPMETGLATIFEKLKE